jgi:hypothetical protein
MTGENWGTPQIVIGSLVDSRLVVLPRVCGVSLNEASAEIMAV